VIKLESAHIEEVRGIRKLDIDFQKSTFAISGPNGSGKSGVIDAIEFALTGSISRLMGRGTKGLSIAEHGPHVDKVKFPDAAFVRVKVFLTDLGKSATVTRYLKTPTKATIEPPDANVKAALAEVAEHPEIALSRREILRFILVEPTERSQGIQTILKLEDVGQIRSALNTAHNKLERDRKSATAQVEESRDALLRHLQLPALKADGILAAVNQRRTLLGLPEITELTSDTKFDDGITAAATGEQFNKLSALRDLAMAGEALAGADKQATTEAAGTQFIITTHDRTWAEQMKTAGLVTGKTSLAFHGWSLDTGPLVESNDEIWTDITNALARGKLETAAHALRYHLEFVARLLAEQLGATPTFRADGNYDLGELLPPVLARIRSLYGKAADSAQSWGKADQRTLVASRKAALGNSNAAVSVDQWAVNKGVHYNEWANFGRKDFEPVVAAYKELVEHFRCTGCAGFLYVAPARGPAEALRCSCMGINLNQVSKAKSAQ
jgi:hypothetical protein